MFETPDTASTLFWVIPDNAHPEISGFREVSYFSEMAGIPESDIKMPFEKKAADHRDIHFGLLAGILLIIGWMLYRFEGAYKKIIRNMTETPASRETFEGDVSTDGWMGLMLSAVALLSWSFFLTVITENLLKGLGKKNILNSLETFAFAVVILLLLILVYSFISLIIRWIMDLDDIVDLLSKFNRYFFQSATIVILPMSVMLSLSVFSGSEYLLYAGLLMLLLLFGFRMLRMLILTSSRNKLSGVLYIILYFCALEIIPLLLAGKVAFSGIILKT